MGIREQLQQLNEIDQFNEEEGPGWWARMFSGKKPVESQTQNKIVYGQKGRKSGDKTLKDHLKNKPVNLGTGEEGLKNLQKEKIAIKKIADVGKHISDNKYAYGGAAAATALGLGAYALRKRMRAKKAAEKKAAKNAKK